MPRPSKPASPFRYFNSSPDVIRLVVMMYVKYPLSLRNVEDLLFERGIDICHETVRMWWNRFGPLFASDIRRQRVSRKHRIVCGDSTDPSVFEVLMAGTAKAALVFTDPPFGCPVDGFVASSGKHREFVMGSGEMSPDGTVKANAPSLI